MDEDLIIKEIPATLKEEVLFHQYGTLMFSFSFFEKIGNNDFVWSMLQNIKKIHFDRNDIIYKDG